MSPPKGFIYRERFYDGDVLKMRVWMHREGHEPVACVMDVDLIPADVTQAMLVYSDLTKTRRLCPPTAK